MSNFYCETCNTAIIEGDNGEYVTGCIHYPIEKPSKMLIHCPECKLENYVMAVLTGKCQWCGYDANKKK